MKVLDNHNADEEFNSEKLLLPESKDVKDNLKNNIREHPLFFGVTLGLLAEIINSRYITFTYYFISIIKYLLVIMCMVELTCFWFFILHSAFGNVVLM